MHHDEQMIKMVKDSITYKLSGASMVVAGMLSDAQELLNAGQNKMANAQVNKAKEVLFAIMDGQLVGTVNRD
jgi:hypothetical protein